MLNFLDCTLRDGGYYNAWDFDQKLISTYLKTMADLPVDIVEIGFRSMPENSGKFKGGCAYCTDEYIRSLDVPEGLRLAVMINGADLIKYSSGVTRAVDYLFGPAQDSPVEMVRIAVHVNKVEETLPAITRLHELGYKTSLQLMQIAGLSVGKIAKLAEACSAYPLDVVYFADSLGSMVQDDITHTVEALRTHWSGELGFHGHNNMEWALANCMRAIEQGVTWVDSTVMGMGRGPGNCKTEYLAIEMESRFGLKVNYTPLFNLIEKTFRPLHKKYNWGPNSYYYMAGKNGIHPTYVQEMISDTRYDGEDILTVIQHLSSTGGKHYSLDNLESARNFYSGKPKGTWKPVQVIKNREVLLLGAGPGVVAHREALEHYILKNKPFVMALNTQSSIATDLIDVRLACHPFRLLADCEEHAELSQPLISPFSMLPEEIKQALKGKEIYDYGLGVKPDSFEIFDTYCTLPNSLVVAYALAVVTSGKAKRVLLSGFDGYGAGDPRNEEMDHLIKIYSRMEHALPLVAVTPTKYQLIQQSIYSCLAS